MKKQLTLAFLSALTFAGGTWLAAQQDEPARDSARKARSEVAESPAFPPAASDVPAAVDTTKPQQNTRTRANTRTLFGAKPSDKSEPSPAEGPESQAFDSGYLRYPAGVMPLNAQGFGPASVFLDTGMPREMRRMSPEEAARMRAFQDAIRELRSALNDEEKAAAREEVTKLVNEQLDADLANRESELAAIEQRAKELRKQLEERKTAKPELLKMLVMLIDNPQVGLGIPPEWMQMLMRGQSGPRQENQFFMGQTRDSRYMFNEQAFPQPPTPPSSPTRPAVR